MSVPLSSSGLNCKTYHRSSATGRGSTLTRISVDLC